MSAKTYPLQVLKCKECCHFQLSFSVSPKILYATNYTYLSNIGVSFVNHIKEFVYWIEDKCKISKEHIEHIEKVFGPDVGSPGDVRTAV